jgi:hypothetical protein
VSILSESNGTNFAAVCLKMWKTDKQNVDSPVEMKEHITVEQHHVEAIGKFVDLKQYRANIWELQSDTPEETHYFNKIRGGVKVGLHYEVFKSM